MFSSIGFAAARVDDIALRAGVNKAMLYYHFGDKQALYTTVLIAVIDRAHAAIVAATQREHEASAKLEAILEAFARLGQSDRHFVPMMLREIASGGAALSDEMLLRMASVFRLVAEVLAEGMGSGAFRKTDPLLTHVSLVGSMMFLIASRPVRERVAKASGIASISADADLARHTADLFLHGLEVTTVRKTAPAKRRRA